MDCNKYHIVDLCRFEQNTLVNKDQSAAGEICERKRVVILQATACSPVLFLIFDLTRYQRKNFRPKGEGESGHGLTDILAFELSA